MARVKFSCPKCGSKKVWVHISIVAKQSLNGDRVYQYEPYNVDNFFEGDCGCDSCGFRGDIDTFDEALRKEKQNGKD